MASTVFHAPTLTVVVDGTTWDRDRFGRWSRNYDVCAPCGNTASVVVLYWDTEGVYDAVAPCPECCPNGRRG